MAMPTLESELSIEEYQKKMENREDKGGLNAEIPILNPEPVIIKPRKRKSKSKYGSYDGILNSEPEVKPKKSRSNNGPIEVLNPEPGMKPKNSKSKNGLIEVPNPEPEEEPKKPKSKNGPMEVTNVEPELKAKKSQSKNGPIEISQQEPEVKLKKSQSKSGLIGIPNPGPEVKKKKPKSKNGSMYVGVQNRNFWLEIQKMYGFDNVNNFSTFMLSSMVFFHENVMQSAKLLETKGFLEIGEVRWLEGYPFCISPNGNVIQLTSNPEDVVEVKKPKDKIVQNFESDLDQSSTLTEPVEICETEMNEILSDNNPYEIESDLEMNQSMDSNCTENYLDVMTNSNDDTEEYIYN